MLILTRRTGERLTLEFPDGTLVYVEVLGVQGNAVRIGITAPRHMAVHREEVYERIQAEMQSGPQVAAE